MNAHDIEYVYLSDNSAINFINTVIAIRDKPVDLLQCSADLINWAVSAGLNISKNKVMNEDLNKALDLRKLLKRIFIAKLDNASPPHGAATALNKYLVHHYCQKLLRFNNDEYHLLPSENKLTMTSLLAHIAYDAASLLSSPQIAQLKRCSNADCVLIFLDTSRNQKRRWCSMETCGNRAKASKHYKKTTHPSDSK